VRNVIVRAEEQTKATWPPLTGVERRSLGSIAPVGKIGIKASLAGAHASEFVVKIEKLGVNLELGASLVRLARCLPGAAHPALFFLGTFP
jgi:hypothetical protein